MKRAKPVRVIVHRPDLMGPKPPPVVDKEQVRKIGLGDVVASVATPIARAIGMDCIEPNTRQLRKDSRCSKRKSDLNEVVADIRHPIDSYRSYKSGTREAPP